MKIARDAYVNIIAGDLESLRQHMPNTLERRHIEMILRLSPQREYDDQERIEKLEAELNTPEVKDFLEGVRREAAHQRTRWGSEHDAGKTDADWFWLFGYLAGKALHKPEKRLHHLVTAAAALFNWHLQTLGKTDMRPGIAPPEET